MKPQRLMGMVLVGLVVAMATAMNVKAGMGLNGLTPGRVAPMTHPSGISHRAHQLYPLTELASRPLVRRVAQAEQTPVAKGLPLL